MVRSSTLQDRVSNAARGLARLLSKTTRGFALFITGQIVAASRAGAGGRLDAGLPAGGPLPAADAGICANRLPHEATRQRGRRAASDRTGSPAANRSARHVRLPQKGNFPVFPQGEGNQLESSAAAYAGLLATLFVAPLAWCSRRHRSITIFLAALGFFALSWCLDVPGLVWLLRLPGLNMMSHNRLVFVDVAGHRRHDGHRAGCPVARSRAAAVVVLAAAGRA